MCAQDRESVPSWEMQSLMSNQSCLRKPRPLWNSEFLKVKLAKKPCHQTTTLAPISIQTNPRMLFVCERTEYLLSHKRVPSEPSHSFQGTRHYATCHRMGRGLSLIRVRTWFV